MDGAEAPRPGVPLGVGDADALANALANEAGITVLATLGGDGALIATGQGMSERFRAPAIEPVDTTGAGDTLCGVLAAGLDAGLTLSDAMQRAVAAASLACLSFGARSAMPKAEAIDAFLTGGQA